MKIASVAEVKSQLSAFLKASEGGPVVVTRNGRAVAVIVGVQDEDEIERLLMAYSPHLRAILERSRKQFREGKWLSEEEFWSQFESAKPSKKSAKSKKKPAEPNAAPDRGGKQRLRESKPRRPPRQVS
jgi:prevent-host-death family protein